MSKSKFCGFSLILISFVLCVLCVFAGCNQKNYVHELSLGEGLPTVQLNGNYYSIAIDDSLKADDCTDYYITDGDEPRIVIYRFDWKTEEGNWNSFADYFSYEANKYGQKTQKAQWTEAGYPEALSYCKFEKIEGKDYIATVYALQDGETCIEFVYLDKTTDVNIEDANVKFLVPKLNLSDEGPDKKENLVDGRRSQSEFFPSIAFYCVKKANANESVHSDSFIAQIQKNENATNLTKEDINIYKALSGSCNKQQYGKVNFTIFEVGDYIVSVYYTANNDEMASHGRNIVETIS